MLLKFPNISNFNNFRILDTHIDCQHKDNCIEEMIRNNLLYEAESPDELALVYAARAYGVILIKRSRYHITVLLPRNNSQTFDILRLLPFDPTR